MKIARACISRQNLSIASSTQRRALYFAFSVMLCMYALLTWLVFTDRFYVDFSSLYIALKTAWQDYNPYRVLMTDYLPVAKKLPANLNPPFTLLLFSPFYFLPYHWALMSYFFSAIILGLLAAAICGHYFIDRGFWLRHRFLLLAFFSSLFSVFTGIAIAQLGAPLFFLIMLAYHFYCQDQEKPAAFFWGMAIAMKLFPGVLLCFTLQQKRYRLTVLTAVWTGLFSLLPLLVYRVDLYTLYLKMMNRVMWYGDSWNASLYGFVMRLAISTENTDINLLPYQAGWALLVIPCLLLYIKNQRLRQDPQRSFALALVVMLLLSPFGWIYYFALLLPAYAISYSDACKRGLGGLLIWFLVVILCNVPIDYVTEAIMENIWYKLSIYSLHSYGLLFLLLLLLKKPVTTDSSFYGPETLFWPLYALQLYSMLVVTTILAHRI